MVSCELCGAPATCKSRVEGTLVDVCEICAGFGKKIVEVKPIILKKPVSLGLPDEMELVVVDDFGKRVRLAREKLGLKQDELSGKIQERSSTVGKVESGWDPPISVLRKLEKFLGITLVE